MHADVVDYDELHTGKRREAQFSALWSTLCCVIAPSLRVITFTILPVENQGRRNVLRKGRSWLSRRPAQQVLLRTKTARSATSHERRPDMELEGKAAIVTGAGTGVGRATALRLAKQGCTVLVNYSRSKDAAERVAAEARSLGVKAIAVRADVAVDEDCRSMVKVALAELGRLDVLINNAGTTRFINHADLDAVTLDDWDNIMGVNLRGPFQCTRAARAALEAHGQGCIVNVSSIGGLRAIGSSIPYCASKGALNTLTLALARALAPKIRVNAVAPGFIAGEWLQQGLGEAYEAVKTFWEGRAVLGKVCEADDVAAAVLSLITGSELVTGQILPVEGGAHLAM